MSICSKITSLTNPNRITIGEDIYDILHPEIKSKFTEVKCDLVNWRYIDRQTRELYKLCIKLAYFIILREYSLKKTTD
jgi:adenylate cyclase